MTTNCNTCKYKEYYESLMEEKSKAKNIVEEKNEVIEIANNIEEEFNIIKEVSKTINIENYIYEYGQAVKAINELAKIKTSLLAIRNNEVLINTRAAFDVLQDIKRIKCLNRIIRRYTDCILYSFEIENNIKAAVIKLRKVG